MNYTEFRGGSDRPFPNHEHDDCGSGGTRRPGGRGDRGHHGHGNRGHGGRGFGARRHMFDYGELRLLLLALIASRPRHGYELIRRIEERFGGAYLSVLGTRKRQVAQLPITVEAATDDKPEQMAADQVREWLARDTLSDELFDILDAIGKGWSASEIVWAKDGKYWTPEAIRWRNPKWFLPDRQDYDRLLLKGGFEGATADDGVALPPGKFLLHRHPAKSGLMIRGGLARPVAWAYLIKRLSIRDWAAFAEIYGRPFRLGRYPNGTSEEQIDTLLRAVAGMGEDAAAVIPEGMNIELISGQGSGGDLYQRLADFLDRQVSKAVLGQTATTDAEIGGLGSGREHGEVRADIERADARLVAGSINRDVVAVMTRLNLGDGVRPPRLKIGREEGWDADKMMPAVRTFVELGGRVEASIIGDKLGLPDAPAGDDEALLRAPAKIEPESAERGARGGIGAASAAPHFSQPLRGLFGGVPGRVDARNAGGGLAAPNSDPATAIVAGVIADAIAGRLLTAAFGEGATFPEDEIADLLGEDWEQALAPMVRPVLAAVQEADGYEEALDALTAAVAAIDTGTIEEALAKGGLVARALALEADEAAELAAASSDETRAKLSEIARRRNRQRGRFANEVGRLVRAAEEKRDQQEVHDLGPLERSNIEAVQRDLGVDLGGYRRVVRDDMLRHALKSHSPIEKELARGQLPLAVAHFDRFRMITSHPDYVARAPKPHMGKPVIEYWKTFEDARLVYTEHVDERNARVSFVTMRAYPVGKKVRR